MSAVNAGSIGLPQAGQTDRPPGSVTVATEADTGPNMNRANPDDRWRLSHIGIRTKRATKRQPDPINSHWAEITELPKYVKANVGGTMPATVANEKVRNEIVVNPAP